MIQPSSLMTCVQSSYLSFPSEACGVIDNSSFLHEDSLAMFSPSSLISKSFLESEFECNLFFPLPVSSSGTAFISQPIFIHYLLASPLGIGAAVSVAGMMEMSMYCSYP